MRNIQREIQENLDAIEKQNNVTILLAIESGSRAWGFASPDSDYDVRFIYVRNLFDYLRIDEQKDTIEWKLDEVLDINGLYLKKELIAFAKGNPNVMEWAKSPIVYREAPEWKDICDIALQYFSEKASLYHYAGIAKNTVNNYLQGDLVRYKKYFYALRPLLCCKWIEKYNEVPPMEFQTLLTLFDGSDPDLNSDLFDSIQDLLEKKAVTEEKDLNPQIPVILDFIKTECIRQNKIAEGVKSDHKQDISALNKCFQKVLISNARTNPADS